MTLQGQPASLFGLDGMARISKAIAALVATTWAWSPARRDPRVRLRAAAVEAPTSDEQQKESIEWQAASRGRESF
jgi:hypothetical protein